MIPILFANQQVEHTTAQRIRTRPRTATPWPATRSTSASYTTQPVWTTATGSSSPSRQTLHLPRATDRMHPRCCSALRRVALSLADRHPVSKTSLPLASLRSASRHTVAPRVSTTPSWIAGDTQMQTTDVDDEPAPYIRLAGVDQRNAGRGRWAKGLRSCHQPPVRLGTASNVACRRRDRPTVGGSTTHPHRASKPDRRL